MWLAVKFYLGDELPSGINASQQPNRGKLVSLLTLFTQPSRLHLSLITYNLQFTASVLASTANGGWIPELDNRTWLQKAGGQVSSENRG